MVVMLTETEIAKFFGYTSMEFLQIETMFRENEDDWGKALDAMTVVKDGNPKSND